MRYMAFSGDILTTKGGWEDYKGSADTLTECLDKLAQQHCTWWHIVDLQTGEITQAGDCEPIRHPNTRGPYV